MDDSELQFPQNYDEAAKLGSPSKLEGINPEGVAPLQKRDGTDYCYGIGTVPNTIRICRTDPGTGLCGNFECVDVPIDKLKRH